MCLPRKDLYVESPFFPPHIKHFLSTFAKYLALITAYFKRRRGYSHNLLSKESSSCKNQLNTIPQHAAKNTRIQKTINEWRTFTLYIRQSMCA